MEDENEDKCRGIEVFFADYIEIEEQKREDVVCEVVS